VSQTDGVDLPEMREISGDPGENLDSLAAFVRSRGIQLAYNENIAPALGMSYGGRIALLPGQSKAEEFSTLVHETAHELLHKAERRTATTKTVRETEAEAVAFVVGKAVGLVTGTASADYIRLYHGNASLLAESLEVIQQTAAVILAALEPSIEDAVIDQRGTDRGRDMNCAQDHVRIGRHRNRKTGCEGSRLPFSSGAGTPCGFLPAHFRRFSPKICTIIPAPFLYSLNSAL
jgi:hypothetical protein